MEQALQVINHPEFGDVRVIVRDGEPLFCLADVCKILGIGNPSQVKTRLDDGVITNEVIRDSLGREQKVTFINEDGLYDLILDSRKPFAKKMRKWITSEVVPSIRKTGVYMTVEAAEKILFNPDFIIGLAQQVKDANAKIAELQPKADYCEKVLESKEHLTSELIAKEYGETAEWLHEKLHRLDKIYKRGKHWYMKAPYAKAGYRDSETVTLERGLTVVNHFWTQKGRNFIYNTLKKSGIVPVAEREGIMADLL